MIIRLANEKDIENIATLYVQNHRETYKGILPDAYFEVLTVDLAKLKWHKHMDTPGKMLWVAYEGEEFLGFSAGMPDSDLPDTWYLDALHISKAARGKGIGTKLIEQNGRHAAENGFRQMSICIIRGNDNARKLYEKLGARHYCYFEDNFAGSVSHSEKLLWNNLSDF